MNDSFISLEWYDLVFASLLVLIAGCVSFGLGLRLEKRLAIASIRTVVQLVLIGYVLRWVFDAGHPAVVTGIMLFMILVAAHEAVRRPTRTIPGARQRAFATLVLSGLLTTFAVTYVVIGARPWYSPQYAIPLLGMILGNGLTGISLSLDQVLQQATEKRDQIFMELAHGAIRWEAARDIVRDSVWRGMIPIVNSMMVVGLVSLPGMMTGQILAGADPVQAVRYQIVVMFMIAAATSLGCTGLVWLVYRRLFNERHQLRLESVREQK